MKGTSAFKKVATALCVSAILFSVLTGCGAEVDYSTWTYEQYQEAAEFDEIYGYQNWNYWDEKTISYQLSGHMPDTNCLVVVNLYEDSSAAIFTAVPFDVASAGLDWLIAVDPDCTNQILNVYYGYWTSQGGTINLKYAKNSEEEFMDAVINNADGTLSGTVSANWLTYAFDIELTGSATVTYPNVQSIVDGALASTGADA